MNAQVGAARLFVGREPERAELRAALAAATGGRGRLVLLIGEPGIGKTRLADLLADEASAQGVEVVWGRCWEGDGTPPYWPWVQILRALLRSRGAERLSAPLGAAVGDLAALLPELTGAPADQTALQGDQARFRLFDATTTALRGAAAATPLLLIVDDLHWADPPSLLLLQFLARELRDAPLLVVATYRDSDVRQRADIAALLGELARDARRLFLRGLSAADVGDFIARSNDVSPSAALSDAVHQATDGNPFFVDEVVHLLAADGRLSDHAPAPETLRIPDGVREAVRRRLDPLGAETRALLSTAAVIGREFDLRMLNAARGDTTGPAGLDRLVETLEAAVASGTLVADQAGVGRYTFAHALIRETLYDDLPPVERLRLHQRVGAALEQRVGGPLEPSAAELAHHFGIAAPLGDAAKALDCARRAAAQALRGLAYEEATHWYDRALALADAAELDAGGRAALLLALGSAAWRAGQWERAESVLQSARALASAAGDGMQQAEIALALGAMHTERGLGDHALLGILDEALAAVGDAVTPLRARLVARLSIGYQYVDPVRQRALAEEAVAAARGTDDPGALAGALQALHGALWDPDSTERRLTLADEIVLLAGISGDGELGLEGRALRIFDLLGRGDAAAADAEIDAYAHEAEALRQPRCRWAARIYRGMQALLRGRYAEAERLAESALTVRQAPSRDPSHFYAAQLFTMRREQDRLRELEDAVERLVQHYPALQVWRAALMFLYAEVGRPDAARRELSHLAAHDFDDLPRDANWLPTVALLGETSVGLGDRPRAERLYTLLRPYAGRVIVLVNGVACRGAVDHYLGILARGIEDWAAAARHFDAALALHARMHAWPWLAHTQFQYAITLQAQGAPGSRAAELIDQAQQAAAALGMSRLARLTAERTGAAAAVTPHPTARQAAAPTSGTGQATALLHREGGYWTVAFDGRVARLKDTKGLRALSVLLQHPDREVSAVELVAELGGATAARADVDAEQARINVTKVIGLAIRKIAAEHAALGHYLTTTITTGRLCSYRPSPLAPIAWDL